MSSGSIATVIKMMENLPDATQDQVVEHLRQYLDDIQDEQWWEEKFEKTRAQLVARARHAKQEVDTGKAIPLNYDLL